MFQTFPIILLITIALGGLSIQAVSAQENTQQALPYSNHTATTHTVQTLARADLVLPDNLASGTSPSTSSDTSLFNTAPPPEKGWKGLAKVLDMLTPSVDTSIPMTASDITDRITALIDQGQYDEALHAIEVRKAQRQSENLMGTDVQLLFLEGRALSMANRHEEAIAVYQSMTVQFPELPEPWNNLASEYVKQGKLDLAEQALLTSLASNPNYATARLNLGIIQLRLAHQSFQQAAQQGIPGARELADQTTKILHP